MKKLFILTIALMGLTFSVNLSADGFFSELIESQADCDVIAQGLPAKNDAWASVISSVKNNKGGDSD